MRRRENWTGTGLKVLAGFTLIPTFLLCFWVVITDNQAVKCLFFLLLLVVVYKILRKYSQRK